VPEPGREVELLAVRSVLPRPPGAPGVLAWKSGRARLLLPLRTNVALHLVALADVCFDVAVGGKIVVDRAARLPISHPLVTVVQPRLPLVQFASWSVVTSAKLNTACQ
jgi:hypothetical protein